MINDQRDMNISIKRPYVTKDIKGLQNTLQKQVKPPTLIESL